MARPTGTTCEPWVDPEEDAASAASLDLAPAVERIARELRERHMIKRAQEPDETVRTKVWKWQSGKATPQAGGHRKSPLVRRP